MGNDTGAGKISRRNSGRFSRPRACRGPPLQQFQALESQVVTLIAHDTRKSEMMEFAAEHFDLLSRFAGRVATGTTGSQRNALAWSKGWPAQQAWVTCYQSDPLGGDAQIA